MPGIAKTWAYNPNDREVNSLADDERKERIAAIDRAWRYRDGQFDRPLIVEPGQSDDNILIDMTGQMIDDKISFVGVPTRIEVPGGIERKPGQDGRLEAVISPDQQKVDDFWDENALDEFVPDLLESGFTAGHAFMRLHWDSDNPEIPGVSLLDPRTITPFWDVTNIKRTLFYRLNWQSGRYEYMQDILPDWMLGVRVDNGDGTFTEPAGNWTIIEYQRKGVRWNEVSRDTWAYPFAPIVEVKNKHRAHSYFGVSEMKRARMNDAVNFIASNTGRIIRFHAHPKTFGLGLDSGQVQETSIDGFWALPDPDADIKNLEMQSDLQSSMRFLEFLQMVFYRENRLVDMSSMKDKIGQLTNFGLRTLFSDQVDDGDYKRHVYGVGLAEVTWRAMAMMGVELAEVPTCAWEDLLPQDRKEIVETLTAEKTLGTTSKQTIAEDLGRDPVIEAERMAEEGSTASDLLAETLTNVAQRGGDLLPNGKRAQQQPIP